MKGQRPDDEDDPEDDPPGGGGGSPDGGGYDGGGDNPISGAVPHRVVNELSIGARKYENMPVPPLPVPGGIRDWMAALGEQLVIAGGYTDQLELEWLFAVENAPEKDLEVEKTTDGRKHLCWCSMFSRKLLTGAMTRR